MPREVVYEIKVELEVEVVKGHSKYLRLPSSISNNKKDIFMSICEKISSVVVAWKTKLVSMGGKEILIKAMGQTIPMYTMSLFKLSKGICDTIHSLFSDF